MITFKIDVLPALKEAGYNTNRIKKEHLIPDATLQKIRKGQTDLSLVTIDKLCCLLSCQPGDILQYTPDTDSDEKQAEG